ncbi:MAG: hypothetical protein ABI461_21565, partial [Polyangiaceae bacterium]
RCSFPCDDASTSAIAVCESNFWQVTTQSCDSELDAGGNDASEDAAEDASDAVPSDAAPSDAALGDD